MAGQKSKILVIGGTGYIGKFILEASVKEGSLLSLLFEKPLSPGKLLDGFKTSGVTLLIGDMYDQESLVKAIKQVDVVISTVGNFQIADQTKIISAIKEAGNVKRFLPSEFGIDVDRTTAFEPAKSSFAAKSMLRRAVEAEGIHYTFVPSNCFAGYYLTTFSFLSLGKWLLLLPRTKSSLWVMAILRLFITRKTTLALTPSKLWMIQES